MVGTDVFEGERLRLARVAKGLSLDELGGRVDGNPGPHRTRAFRRVLHGRYVLLFRRDERPHLIQLETATGQVPHHVVLVTGTRPARVDEQLLHRVERHPGHAGGGPHGTPFSEGTEDGDTVGDEPSVQELAFVLTGWVSRGSVDAGRNERRW